MHTAQSSCEDARLQDDNLSVAPDIPADDIRTYEPSDASSWTLRRMSNSSSRALLFTRMPRRSVIEADQSTRNDSRCSSAIPNDFCGRPLLKDSLGCTAFNALSSGAESCLQYSTDLLTQRTAISRALQVLSAILLLTGVDCTRARAVMQMAALCMRSETAWMSEGSSICPRSTFVIDPSLAYRLPIAFAAGKGIRPTFSKVLRHFMH